MPGPYDDLIPDQPLRKDIRTRESGGRNLPPQANYDYPRSHANSDYQIQPSTWRSWTKQFGIGQQYPEADKAPAGIRDAVSEMAIKAYGPNATRTWAASGPYREKRSGAYDDLVPKQAMPNAYHDLIPQQGPQRDPGSVDPSIVARKKAVEPTGYFAPEKKIWTMLTADPAVTMKKIGAATVEEAKSIIGQLSPSALTRLAKTVGKETAENKATTETAGQVANLAQLGARGAPGGKTGLATKPIAEIAGTAAVEKELIKPADKIPMKVEAEPIPQSVGAAATNKAILQGYQAVPPVPTDKFINSTDDSFFRLRGAATADKSQFDNFVNKLPSEMKDSNLEEKFYKHMEGDTNVLLTLPEQALYDKYVKPLKDEEIDLYEEINKLSPGTLNSTDYAHRMVKGQAREFDPWMGEANEAASPVSGYRSRSTGSLKDRVYYAIENDKGTRKVVAVTDHGTVMLNRGQAVSIPRYQGSATALGDKFTIGGENWEVKQARTSEIEANTPTRYYKNALASTIKNVVQLRAVARALNEIERLKSTPEWAAYTREKPREGWETVDFPPFHGRYFEPKFANIIKDFWTYRKPALGEKLAAINRFAVGSLFWSPVPHALNAGAHWATARGWDWVTPKGLQSFAVDSAKAVREVVTQGPEYQRMLREGSGLIYGSVSNEQFYRNILKVLGESVRREPAKWDPIARAMGVGPSDLVGMLYGTSSRALWAVSDMMMMQRVFELERQGMKVRDAIADAEKHIPNYRIPPQVLGSRMFALTLKDPSLTVFSRYHYGQWKSLANMAKDLAVGTPQEKFRSMGNVFATAILITIVAPIINGAIQRLTGDDKLEMGPKGSTTIPINLWDAWNGKPISQVIQNSITIAPAPKMLYEGMTNRDWFTGRDIVEPYDVEKHRFGRVGAQVGEQAAQTMVSPYGAVAQGMSTRQPSTIAGSIAKQGLGLRKPFQPYHGKMTGGGTLAQQAARRYARPRGPIEQLEKKAEQWLNE